MDDILKEEWVKYLMDDYCVNKAFLKPTFQLKPPEKIYKINGTEFKEYSNTRIDNEIVNFEVREEDLTDSDRERLATSIDTPTDLTITKVDNGVVVNSNVFIGDHSWNTVVPLEEVYQCAVCDTIVNQEQVENHINNEEHKEKLDRCKPLPEYELNVVRKIKTHYHCGVCNVITVSGIEKHLLTPNHNQNYNNALNKASGLLISDKNEKNAPLNAPATATSTPTLVNNGPVHNQNPVNPPNISPNLINPQQYYNNVQFHNGPYNYNQMVHNLNVPNNQTRPAISNYEILYGAMLRACGPQNIRPGMNFPRPVNNGPTSNYGPSIGTVPNMWPVPNFAGFYNNNVAVSNNGPVSNNVHINQNMWPTLIRGQSNNGTVNNIPPSNNGPISNSGPAGNNGALNQHMWPTLIRGQPNNGPANNVPPSNNVPLNENKWPALKNPGQSNDGTTNKKIAPSDTGTISDNGLEQQHLWPALKTPGRSNNKTSSNNIPSTNKDAVCDKGPIDKNKWPALNTPGQADTKKAIKSNGRIKKIARSKKLKLVTVNLNSDSENINSASTDGTSHNLPFDIGTVGNRSVDTEVGPIDTEVGPINTEVGPINTEVGPINTEVGSVNTDIGAASGMSYASAAKKIVVTPPEFLFKEYDNKVVKVRFDSWNMIICVRNRGYYCMACKMDVIDRMEHCSTDTHIVNIQRCHIVDAFEDYFIRQVDDKFYHCGHCNNLKFCPDMARHIATKHPQAKKNNNNIEEKIRSENNSARQTPTNFTLNVTENVKASEIVNDKISKNADIRDYIDKLDAIKSKETLDHADALKPSATIKANELDKGATVKGAKPKANEDPERATDSPASKTSDGKSTRESESPEVIKVATETAKSSYFKKSNVFASDIKICPFDMELRINLLSYNTVFMNADNLVCGLCDALVPKDDPVHHICGTVHTEILRCTPFICNFNNNLIREIKDRLHCAICNVFMPHDNIFNHIMNPPHTTLFTKASASDKPGTQAPNASPFRPPTPATSMPGPNMAPMVGPMPGNIPTSMPGQMPNPIIGWWPPLPQCGMPMPNPMMPVAQFAPPVSYPVWPYVFPRCPAPPLIVPVQGPVQTVMGQQQPAPVKSPDSTEDGSKQKKKPESPGTNVHTMVFSMGGSYKAEAEEEVKLNEKKIDSNVIKEIAKVKEKAAKCSDVKTDPSILVDEETIAKIKDKIRKFEMDELSKEPSDSKTEKEIKVKVNEKIESKVIEGKNITKEDAVKVSVVNEPKQEAVNKTPDLNETNGANGVSSDVASRIKADIFALLNDNIIPLVKDTIALNDPDWEDRISSHKTLANEPTKTDGEGIKDFAVDDKSPWNFKEKINISNLAKEFKSDKSKQQCETDELVKSPILTPNNGIVAKSENGLIGKSNLDAKKLTLAYDPTAFIKTIWVETQEDIITENKSLEDRTIWDASEKAIKDTSTKHENKGVIVKPNLDKRKLTNDVKKTSQSEDSIASDLNQKKTDTETPNIPTVDDAKVEKKNISWQEDKKHKEALKESVKNISIADSKRGKNKSTDFEDPKTQENTKHKKTQKVSASEEKVKINAQSTDLNELVTPKELETTVLDAEDYNLDDGSSINESTSDVNEITLDLNEPYDVEEYVYLKLRDVMFKISFSAYNSLVPSGDGNRCCFVCWEPVICQDFKHHIASAKHDDNLKSCKFMYHYKLNLIRWKNSAYHCGVCNVIVTTGIQKHLSWQYHKFQLEEIKRSPRQLARDLKKGEVKQIRPFMTKKVYTCTNPPKLVKLNCESMF